MTTLFPAQLKIWLKLFLAAIFTMFHLCAMGITTSWKGTTSNSWTTTTNWTSGVPTATIDVIIGDVNFTGANQPSVTSPASLKSLTIGNETKVCVLTMGSRKNLTVFGNVVIGTNGSIVHNSKCTFSLTGNFTNAGSYVASDNNAGLTFSGSTQLLSGTGTHTYRLLTINAGSTTTLGAAVSCRTFTVSGLFDPSTFLVSISNNFTINNSGTVKVNTSLFSGNFSRNPTINNTATINYSATTINQTVASLGYGKLVISGAMTKTLAASATLRSGTSTTGNISLEGGTLDLATFTLNRGTTTVGGTFTILNGTILRIGGTNTFPANYQNSTIGSTSTVEYYGANQTVASKPYGNLLLSQSGTCTKIMPSVITTISGNFTSSVLAGTMTITGSAHFNALGNFTLGANSIFNANSFTDTISGISFINNGTITGGTGRFVLNGVAAQITGAGIFNFNDLELRRSSITAAAAINLSISGNLSTSGPGTFTHTSGSTGTITLTGTSKTISGTGIALNNLTIAGTITSTSLFDVWGNLVVNSTKSLIASTAGTISMKGSGKTITNSGTLSFFELNIPSGASITTATSFNMYSDLSVAGSLTASAGTVTFIGTSVLSGTANLFNATLNGIKLTMGNNAILGIASAFSLSSGLFDVTTSTPNTVEYNGTAAQSVSVNGFNRLKIAGSNIKSATTSITINENLVIANLATFAGGTALSHIVRGDWTNNGTFTANTSTVTFSGASDAYIGGTAVTTFNAVVVNKSLASLVVYINTKVTLATIAMTLGTVRTGTDTLKITTTRTGTGYIYGIIKRTHTFNINTAYEFEGQYNTITFTSGSAPTSVTVEVATDPVVGFPFGSSVNRLYNISVTGGGVYAATVRLHYLQGELNGNNEANMTLWRFNTGTWGSVNKTSNNTTTDYLELISQADITNKWTFSEISNVAQWTGATNTDWGTATNWSAAQGTPSTPPGVNDVALFGNSIYTNQPTLGTSTTIKGVEFKSATATTLTLNASGSLTLAGSLAGAWTSNATHTIAVGSRTLVVNGDITLGDGTANHDINLSASTGTITIGNALTQKSGSIINLTGAANLNIGSDFIKTSTGAFNCGTSTTTLNGALAQLIPGVTYHNLNFTKTGGAASLGSNAVVNGNLTMSGGTSQLDLNANITILGNVSFGTLQTINCNTSTISVGGNWAKTGPFIQGSGTVIFNGTDAQTLNAMNFNNLIINKSADTLSLTGNATINGDLTLSSGNLDLKTFTCSRTAIGGILSLSAGTRLKIGGASNFPSNFDNLVIPATSTVEYNGTIAQTVKAVNYGNLTFSNGGSVSKSLAGSVTVNGDVDIKTNSSFDALAFTIDLYGNWIDSGTFVPSTSTVKMSGGIPNMDSTKYIYGRNSFYNATITGRYSTTPGTVIILLNTFTNVAGATYTQLGDSSYFYGNFFNFGRVGANGITTFMGTRAQNVANNGIVTSTPTGVISYIGTIAPVLTSTGSSSFYTLKYLNTDPAGISPTVPWTVAGPFTVGSGATFNAGGLTHTFYGNFYNNGSINSTGTFIFHPLSGNTLVNLGTVFNSSGVVKFRGANKIDISGSTSPTFGALEISNTNVAGITPATDWTVNGNFTIFSGAKFNGDGGLSNNILSLGGNFTNNGSFYGGNSTVVLIDTAAITGTSSITEFNNLTINSVDSALIDFSVSGNFTNNGTFLSSGYETTFKGSNPATIDGMSGNVNFFDLTFSKTNSDVTLASRISVDQDFINNVGTQVIISTDSITLAGNWTNHGSYQDSISTAFATAYFNGAGVQTISGTAPTNFGNLNVNNSNGVVIASAQTVNGVLTLTDGDINSTGFLKLNLDRGAISATGAGTITGNIVTTKSIPSMGYHYLSSPLSGRTAADWHDDLPLDPTSPRQNYYYYNEANTSADKALGWTPITSTAENLTAIKGFAMYFPDATVNMDMTATYNHATTSYSTSLTLTRSTPAGNGSDGWNLVGNPFPNPLDWDAGSGWSKSNILDAIYCWDPSNDRYTSYIAGSSANGGNKFIPAMQAFWVRLDTTGAANKSISLGIANGTRVTSVISTPSIWREAAKSNILKLTATNEYNFDETIIRFQDSATIGFDGMFDAYKMASEGNTPNFFSTINGNQFSINTLPMLGQEFKLALPLTAAKSGKMIIAADQIGAIDDNIALLLFDKTKNVTQDLKENPNYSFDYDHTDTTTRFYLNMIPVITGLQESQEPSIQIVEFNKILTVNFNHINDKTALIKVVDVLGRIVFETNEIDPSNKKYQKELANLLPGVYLVEVQTNQKKMSSRILLR